LCVLALVPNLTGALRAIEAGAHKMTIPVSASRAHSQANIRKSPEEAVAEVRDICSHVGQLPEGRRPGVEVGISTAFGCTIEGPVSEDWVIDLAIRLADAGADSIGLSDTTGYANPTQVRRLFRRLRSEVGAKAGGAHLHNTRGQGLANVVAALDADVRTFDSSQGGLGGCPYAPGASGNIVTEDLVFMLEAMGLRTGVGRSGSPHCREGQPLGRTAVRAPLWTSARSRLAAWLHIRRREAARGGCALTISGDWLCRQDGTRSRVPAVGMRHVRRLVAASVRSRTAGSR
jgi:hypothetical protein